MRERTARGSMRWPAAQTWPVIRTPRLRPPLCRPASTFNNVVLPEPLGPRMQVRWPGLAVPLTPRRICTASRPRPGICHDDMESASQRSSSDDSPKEENLDLPMHHSSVSLPATAGLLPTGWRAAWRGRHHRQDQRGLTVPKPPALLEAALPGCGDAIALEPSDSCLAREAAWHSFRVPPPKHSLSEITSSSSCVLAGGAAKPPPSMSSIVGG
mmetsp:Transcript_46666/g.129855  ORF Transcript_46666/g.129855 Transcript_46666/m.129855 type:complete len:213 (+) Transcript_46666:505-1143(+)